MIGADQRSPAYAGDRASERLAESNWFPGPSKNLPRSYRQAEAPCSRTLCPGGERAAEIAAGPGVARAYTGALQKDLRRLAELFGGPAWTTPEKG